MKYSLFLIVLLSSMMACSDAHNYDVYVFNESGQDLLIRFKLLKDRSGVKEEEINLKNGAQQKIISTVNFNSAERPLKPIKEHCSLVAEYIDAFANEQKSSLKWCDDEIDFVVEDIGEGRFTMVFKAKHFE